MNKKRVALALAAALGVSTLTVALGEVGGQVRVAHAQNARLVGDQEKLLDGIKIKNLTTAVEISSTGDALITFPDLKKEDIKNVRMLESFKHEVFGERKDIDTKSSDISGTWDSATGKLKLNSKITQPGIYTGKVEIELNNGTKETYTISLRRTPSDSVSFTSTVGVGTVEVSGLVLNNGVGNTTYKFTEKDLELTNKRTGKTAKATLGTSGGFVFSAIDLTTDGKLQESDVLELKVTYGTNSEYTLTTEILLVRQADPQITNAFASNNASFATDLKAEVNKDFNVSDADTGAFSTGTNRYAVKAGGNTLFSYVQTIGGDQNVVGGPELTATPNSNNNGVDLKLGAPTLYSTTPANVSANFVGYVEVGYTHDPAAKTGLVGDYYIKADGEKASVYFDATSGITAALDSTTSANSAFLAYTPDLPAAITVNPDTYSVGINFNSVGHGYSPISIEFGVDAASDLKQVTNINSQIADLNSTTFTDKHLATSTTIGGTVSATVVVVTDILDGAHAQAKFEQTSTSEGKIILVDGKKVVGTSTDLNNVRLTVGGATASIIGSESTGNDLVFSVQFNGQVPTSIDWSLVVNNTNKVKGTLETGVLESTNIKSVKATNSGTSNIKDQFTVEAQFNLTFPNSTTKVTIDSLNSDRVTLDQFKTGEHTVNVTSQTGKYQGTYKAGVIVTQQPFAIEVKDAKSASNTSATVVVDANFFNTADIAKVPGGVIQYSEKTVNGNTTTWSDWKDSLTKIDKADVKEDAITKTVSGLTGGRTYKFRAVYDYNNGTTTEKVYSNETGEVTLPTSSSSSTITGSGSTTSGTSTGSTTITANTNNSTLTGTTASVKLPSGFRYDSSKTPVPVTLKYKDKDGKIVTETKEQHSNVTAKFNGDNIEVTGLVPGKNYEEITIDYTDNNGRTRSIILKNVKTTSQTQVETYLANVYEVVFGRPADEAGYHFHLDNLKNKKVSLREFLLNMLKEKEFVEKYKSTEEKIEALYSAIVNRTSDEAGKKFWVDEYKKVLAVYGSESAALQAIADRMVNEPELKELADKMNVQW